MKKIYHNPFIVILISFFVIALGLKQFFELPIALYPDTSQPVINVGISPQNMSAQDFKERYGKKIEAALSSVEKLKMMEGNYNTGHSRWELTFEWGVDENRAKLDIESALSSIKASLPEEWNKFHIRFRSSNSSNIYISLYSENYSRKELRDLVRDKVLNHVESIEGIDDPQVWLPMHEYIRVELKPSLLEARGIIPGQIKKALQEKKYDLGLGRIESGRTRYDVLVPIRDKTLEDIKKTIIHTKKGQSYRLEDFSEVSIATKHHDHLMKGNGKKALIAKAGVKPSGNISFVCKEFIKKLTLGLKQIDPEIKINVLTNPSKFIEEAIFNILVAILMGILIATLIIFLFLNSFSNTFVIALSIPLSLIGGFILMSLLDIEINLISLGAMALSVGMVVDGAIVVLENIARHFELKKPTNYAERVKTVIGGVSEVKAAVIASLFTTIIVFAPLAFTAPLANAILGDLARVMVCVLVISVVVTLYLVPPLLVLLRTSEGSVRKNGVYYFSYKFSLFIDKIQNLYIKLLDLLIRGKRKSLIFLSSIVFLLLLSVWVLNSHVKREIIAQPDSDKVWLIANFSENESTVDKANKIFEKEVESVVEKEFGSSLTHYFSQVHKDGGSLLCNLKNKAMLSEFKEQLEKRFKNSAQISYYVDVWNPTSLRIPREALFDIKVGGRDDEEKRKTLKSIEKILKDFDEIGRTSFWPYPYKNKYYELSFHKEKIARMEEELAPGLSKKISDIVGTYLNETYVKTLELGSLDYDVKLFYPDGLITGPEDLKNIMIKIKDQFYPLRNFAYLSLKDQEGEYYTENSREAYRAKVYSKHSFTGDKELLKTKVIEKFKQSKDFDFNNLFFEETGKEINESIVSLIYALLIALILILFVLVLQFGTFKQTFIIMLAIPLGVIGVAFSLYLFSSTLSVNSMLGIILLSGTAVNNSIIFVDFFNQIYEGSSLNHLADALLRTARLRLRPILITTLTTILGMMPIAFAFGSGGEVLQPLGIAVCGGLGLSTFFTLFVIPLILYKVEGRKWA